MKKIETGHTNEVFQDGNRVLIKKNNNGLNHRIKYQHLKEFDFVPELISDSQDEQEWVFIEGETLKNPNKDDLKQLAEILRKIHTSDVKFPKNNLRTRIKRYLDEIHGKFIHIPEIEDNWRLMNNLINKMGSLNPSHNDIWWENLIKDKENKIWIVDWEYATMGDKHFDLAYYIESAQLSKDDEETFLAAYNNTEDFQAYIPQWMDRYKMFVNWLTLIWATAQDKEPFPLDGIKNRINELKHILY